jgi:hypothetical protein
LALGPQILIGRTHKYLVSLFHCTLTADIADKGCRILPKCGGYINR